MTPANIESLISVLSDFYGDDLNVYRLDASRLHDLTVLEETVARAITIAIATCGTDCSVLVVSNKASVYQRLRSQAHTRCTLVFERTASKRAHEVTFRRFGRTTGDVLDDKCRVFVVYYHKPMANDNCFPVAHAPAVALSSSALPIGTNPLPTIVE